MSRVIENHFVLIPIAKRTKNNFEVIPSTEALWTQLMIWAVITFGLVIDNLSKFLL